MEEIPRYSYDLIDELDKLIITPQLPATFEHWKMFDENIARQAAFLSGQRALVNLLLAMRADVEKEKADARGEGTDTPEDPEYFEDPFGTGGPVLDPDGNPHKVVASTHVAARLARPLPDGGGNE